MRRRVQRTVQKMATRKEKKRRRTYFQMRFKLESKEEEMQYPPLAVITKKNRRKWDNRKT